MRRSRAVVLAERAQLPVPRKSGVASMQVGATYGRLTVIGRAPDRRQGTKQSAFDAWFCLCACGSDVRDYLGNSLRTGGSTSCGCKRREMMRALISTRHAMAPSHGPNSPCWKGGRQVTKRGYVELWVAGDDPLAPMIRSITGKFGSGYVGEHRLVMARYLGRPLARYEEVHHIDGNRQNNDLANLQLRVQPHGSGAIYRCRKCGSCDLEAVPL